MVAFATVRPVRCTSSAGIVYFKYKYVICKLNSILYSAKSGEIVRGSLKYRMKEGKIKTILRYQKGDNRSTRIITIKKDSENNTDQWAFALCI